MTKNPKINCSDKTIVWKVGLRFLLTYSTYVVLILKRGIQVKDKKEHVLVKTKLKIVKKTYYILIILICIFFHISEMEMNLIIDRVSQFIWLYFSFFMVHKIVIYLRFNEMSDFQDYVAEAASCPSMCSPLPKQ